MNNRLFPTIKNRHSQADLFQGLQSEVGRVFDQFDRWFPGAGNLDLTTEDNPVGQPSIDVSETEKAVEVLVDVPGVKESDIDVQLDGSLLTVKGTREEERTRDDKDYKVIERVSGNFMRRVRLAFEPEAESVSANLDAGVLKLVINKPEQVAQKVKKISINNSAA